MTSYENVMEEIRVAIAEAIKKNGFAEQDLKNQVNMVDTGFGDVTCSIAFKISKMQKTDPQSVSDMIVKQLEKPNYIDDIKAEKGFISFYLNREIFSSEVVTSVTERKNDTVTSNSGKRSKVIIEYPSVNPNKPWHIGHLRNALLGDTISNIYAACGYSVEREDYIDDMGLQVVQLLWGYMNNLKMDDSKKFDHAMGELYVQVNKRITDGNLSGELSRLISQMEMRGTKEAKVAREMTEKTVFAQYKTAFDYGIYHDVLVWESDIVHARLLDKAMQLLEKSGAVRKRKRGNTRTA